MKTLMCTSLSALSLGLAAAGSLATNPSNFTNWESPHVSPLAVTPDGTRLLAVNTADARLEVFSITGPAPVKAGSVPVGLDPVTVRVRSNTEAWVVNHISDTVSVVDLTTLTVTATLKVQDEPWDVVFAGPAAGQKAYVSCGQTKVVMIFDPANLATAAVNIPILGEQPRSMSVSPDGLTVYVAIFESGNNTTVLAGGAAGTNITAPLQVVNNAAGPYGGVNPPPNSGAVFSPAIAAQNTSPNPLPPKVSLIVRKNAAGQWMDDNSHNWTNFVSGASAAQSSRPVGWDLYDNDVAMINTATNAVSYVHGLMNLCMSVAVNPATGNIAVVGTDATNEIRFEPVLKGKFIKVLFAGVNPLTPAAPTITDLNPHLTYSVSTVPQGDRDLSLGDPRNIAFNASGTTAYVCGLGSSNVAVVDATGARVAGTNVINVGKGPTGLALDATGGRLFVLNKFDASISTVDTASRTVQTVTPFFDPTPTVIKVGRKHLYDTHKNSGLGQIACASCHIDATMDRLAWDLGDPQGTPVAVSTATRNLGQGLFGLEPGSTNTPYQPYHPMKGPMTTQTLQDIIAHEPHHWRGDKMGIEEFNGAFISLQGDDTNLTPMEMQEFEDFLATLTIPPNPYRNFDNTLPTALPLPGHFTTGRFAAAGAPLPVGNPQNGLAAYRSQTARLDTNTFACVTCHTLPTGEGTDMKQSGPLTPGYSLIPIGPNGEHHLQLVSTDGLTNITMKTPQLRNLYRKVGFNMTQLRNTSGFGVLHDGSVDSIERFVSEPVFTVANDQMIADLTAFILCFSGSDLPGPANASAPLEPPGPASKDTHAAVGAQTTASASIDTARINAMLALADANKVGVIAKGLIGGVQRGYRYDGAGLWTPDRRAEGQLSTATLEGIAGPSSPITFTVVVRGQQTRLGIDRDEDGWLDRDEASVCTDTDNAAIHPGMLQSLDVNGDLAITVQDIFDFLNGWFAGPADFNRDGATTINDVFDYLNAWFTGCP
jgi:YVTN family beta-propeller protein